MNQQDFLVQTLFSIITDPSLSTIATENQIQRVGSLFDELNYIIWVKLMQVEGPRVATAACVPIWDTINYLCSSICHLNNELRGFFILVLTSLYPKYKDKRCFFQQSSSQYFNVIINKSPLGTWIQSVKCVLKSGKLLTDENKGMLTNLLRGILGALPSCKILQSSCNELTISDGSWECPFSLFRCTVWSSIAAAEVNNLLEGKSVESFLMASPWSQTNVLYNDEEKRYSFFFEHFIDTAKILISVGNPLCDGSTDNVPLIEANVAKQFFVKLPGCVTTEKKWTRRVVLKGVPLSHEKDKRVKEINEQYDNVLLSTQMDGRSSVCRSADELSLFCRDLVFKCRKSAFRESNHSSMSKITRRLLFQRKQCSTRFSSSFLPENETELFKKEESSKSDNLLEYIISTSL